MDQSTKPMRVIRSYDPALDLDKLDDVAAYTAERDPSKIKGILREGAKPTIFHLMKATRRGCRHIRGGEYPADCNERAFAVCVTRVEGADGRSFSHPSPDGAKAAPDSWLENFDELDIQEIGSVALNHSFLARDLPPFYPRQGMSQSALTALLYRRAVRTRDSEQSSPDSSEPPKEAPPLTPTS